MENKTSFWTLHAKKLRYSIYASAFIIRLLLAIFFQDGVVFFDTGLDIFINHTTLYANTTLQSTFNYFPFAYLVSLPQIWLYYQQPFRNDVLLRLFFKVPKIVADLVLAWLVSDKVLSRFAKKDFILKDNSSVKNRPVNNFELFILFNPIIIYISAMTNQIDIFPAILLVLCWYAYKNEYYFLSGMLVMSAFLIKEYAFFLAVLIFLALVMKSVKAALSFAIGNILVFVPTIVIIALINFQGFLDHAIIYQLSRQPIGSSLSAFVYEIGTAILPKSIHPLYQSAISIAGFALIASVLLFGSFKVVQIPSDKNVIFYSVLSFFAFCIFNKVFWPQYLVPLLALWVLYRIESKHELSNEFIYWTILVLPLFLLYRAGEFATPVLVAVFSNNFFLYFLLLAIVLHIILLVVFFKYNKISFRHKQFIIGYFIFIIFIISQISFQWYFIHLSTYTLQSMPK